MTFTNYQRLSDYYDEGWGNFAGLYLQLLEPYLKERKIEEARIVDLACGTGKLVWELAKRGHQVYGVDLSPEMIQVAREKTSNLPNATFGVQNMTELTLEGKFDLVTCTFDSINYLVNQEDVQQTFRRVASVLEPGGLFVLDANTEQMYLKHHHGVYVKEIGEDSITHVLDYNPQERIASTRFEFVDGVEEHRQRAYSVKEMELMLKQAGFNLIDTFANFRREAVTEESERVFYIAELDV